MFSTIPKHSPIAAPGRKLTLPQHMWSPPKYRILKSMPLLALHRWVSFCDSSGDKALLLFSWRLYGERSTKAELVLLKRAGGVSPPCYYQEKNDGEFQNCLELTKEILFQVLDLFNLKRCYVVFYFVGDLIQSPFSYNVLERKWTPNLLNMLLKYF